MIINVQLKEEQNKKIIIQITNSKDPLILYLLELNELEYQKIIEEQKLFINFDDFPKFLLDLVYSCVEEGENGQKYMASIYLDNSPEVVFIIEEKIKFKLTEHIKLILRKANDEEIKKYLGKKYLDLKNKFNDILLKLNDECQKNDILTQDNLTYIRMEDDYRIKTENILNDKQKEINSIKESAIKESETQLELYKTEKQNIISNFENQISEMQNKIDILTQNKLELEDRLLKIELDKNNYKNKYETSDNELIEKIKDYDIIKLENKSINDKNLDLEKNLEELKSKNNALHTELEESHKNNFNLNIIIDSLKKQLESKDDIIKSLKSSNLTLKEKLDRSIDEIKKGNNIIDKLSNDIKNKKSKLKSVKQTVDIQEDLIRQKQDILDEQTKNIDNYKKDSEMKNQEIIGLKNTIKNYNNKLNENEKLLEENKQMILYLNKNLNDLTNTPFKTRFQKSQYNNNNLPSSTLYFSRETFNSINNNSNDINNPNYDNKINVIINEDFKELNDNKNNYNINNLDIDNDNNEKNNLNSYNYKIDYIRDISEKKYPEIIFNNNLYNNNLNLVNEDEEDAMIILPETNLCNYNMSGKLGNSMDKYINKEGIRGNYDLNDNKDSILEHKYGNKSSNSEINNGNNIIIRNTYNIEEEFPNKLKKSYV